MAKQRFINNFYSQFAAPVKAAPTTSDPDNELDYGILRISSGAAVFLSQLTDGDWYMMTGYKKSGSVESNIEILKVLAVDTSVVNELRLYVKRAQEGTQPQNYVPGDYIGMRITAGGLANLAQQAQVTDGLAGKVDKVAGKGLSTEDYTTADKSKLAGVADQATKNATDAQLRDRTTHTGAQPISSVTGLQTALDSKVDKVAGKALSTEDYTTAEKNKLAAVAAGATANATDAQLRDRATHTGTQPISSVANLQASLDARLQLAGGQLTGLVSTAPNTGALTAVNGSTFQVIGSPTDAAFMSFHRAGSYAINFGIDTDNVLRCGGWSAGSGQVRFSIDTVGNYTSAGNVTAYSDERLKKDWAPLSSDFLEQLASLLHGTFTRIDSGERQAGISAQGMRNLLPEVVMNNKEGVLSVAYGNAAMVSCVQLAIRLLKAEERIQQLESTQS
ncbi:hypothetical protein HNP33_003055 [Comamonas odontotermitis]|uniref:Peptidase S74 domain-containing protein n=1 Tax=Comamonas odontotermitis TaxID=379895 RepID=A0ABR6RIF3_9BURK|nr:tail fiber domain-containing protein [Comamonas odontotermitis]MBB6578950.1 hypothetical protein [Comamonas odontotermitis]